MIKCREMDDSDISAAVDLLTRSFKPPREYWQRAISRLAGRPPVDGFPKYGFVLVDDSRIVGVLLLITTRVRINGVTENRTNVSSWCVEPAYRGYATILSMLATRRLDTTYFNTTPAVHTWKTIEHHGFERFAAGRVVALPALCPSPRGANVQEISSRLLPGLKLDQGEIDLLMDHKAYGCLSLVCEFAGVQYPFVFVRQFRYGFLPLAHLIYCSHINDFARFAGTLGRFLLRRGFAVVVMDADEMMPGLVGKYFGHRPRYRKGGTAIHLGDVAYSEQALFGF